MLHVDVENHKIRNIRHMISETLLGVASSLGKVRSHIVKNVAKDLMGRFPNKFTNDFSSNKQLVEDLTNVASKKLKNRIAGYVTRLIRLPQYSEGKSRAKTMET